MKTQTTATETEPEIPTKDRQIFELLHPGSARHPAEYEAVSAAEVDSRLSGGTLRGFEIIRGPGTPHLGMPVYDFVSRIKSGLLETMVAGAPAPAAAAPAKDSKTNDAEIEAAIKASVATCDAKREAILTQNKAVIEAKADLTSLQQTANLTDQNTLSRIAALQALISFAPGRLSSLIHDLDQEKRDLVETATRFARRVLGGLKANTESRLLSKISADLKPHFTDPEPLDVATRSSDLFIEWSRLAQMCVIDCADPDNAEAFAERLLAARDSIVAFRRKLG